VVLATSLVSPHDVSDSAAERQIVASVTARRVFICIEEVSGVSTA
jgi:hypothetical protein